MKSSPFSLAILVILLAGCYDSSITGDVHADTAIDTTFDSGVDIVEDTSVDAVVDTSVDPIHDPPPDAECVAHGSVTTNFWVDGYPDHGDINVELVCNVEDWVEYSGLPRWEILLLCYSDEGLMEEHRVTLEADPYLMYPYPPAEDLVFRYVRESMWPGSRWFTLSAEGGWLVAAGTSATTLAPPEEDPLDWYAPLEIFVTTGICPIEDTECGPYERMGLDMTMDTARSVLLDGNRGTVGSMMGPTAFVNVQDAWQYHDLMCDGAPSTWYQFSLVVPPSM